jgi:hypothetical protein
MLLRILPFIVSMILLAAHFFRTGNMLFVIICLVVPFLLLIKTRWALISAQIFTYVGVLLWVLTAFELVRVRMAAGADYLRMLLILLAVAAFSGWAAYLLNRPAVKQNYL